VSGVPGLQWREFLLSMLSLVSLSPVKLETAFYEPYGGVSETALFFMRDRLSDLGLDVKKGSVAVKQAESEVFTVVYTWKVKAEATD
jgi:hypothetical protein